MHAKPGSSFIRPATADVRADAAVVDRSIDTMAHLRKPWAATVPTHRRRYAAIAALQKAFQTAAAADSEMAMVAAGETARVTLAAYFSKIAPYLDVADTDIALLDSIDRKPRRDSALTPGHTPLAAPDGFRLEHSELSGVIVARAQRLSCAGSYEVQITRDDPSVNAHWVNAGSFRSCSHIDLAGLTPGTTCSVRLRGVGSQGPGAWTAAATVLVV